MRVVVGPKESTTWPDSQKIELYCNPTLRIYILLPKIGKHKNKTEIIMHKKHFPYIVQILEIT